MKSNSIAADSNILYLHRYIIRKINVHSQCFIFAFAIMAVGCISMACECSSVAVATQWGDAAVVFKGRIISVTDGPDHSLKTITLQADNVYKGPYTKGVVTILTPSQGPACGVIFEQGKEYILFGSKRPSLEIDLSQDKTTTYFTDQCSGTREWSKDYEQQLYGGK